MKYLLSFYLCWNNDEINLKKKNNPDENPDLCIDVKNPKNKIRQPNFVKCVLLAKRNLGLWERNSKASRRIYKFWKIQRLSYGFCFYMSSTSCTCRRHAPTLFNRYNWVLLTLSLPSFILPSLCPPPPQYTFLPPLQAGNNGKIPVISHIIFWHTVRLEARVCTCAIFSARLVGHSPSPSPSPPPASGQFSPFFSPAGWRGKRN
jgi:hypothetical protein